MAVYRDEYGNIITTRKKKKEEDDPTQANSASSPMLVTPKTYNIKRNSTYKGEMKITSKPISVCKIDFKVIEE